MEIREIIKARGFTLTWLAEEIGLKPRCFNHKVLGQRRFKQSELARLAEVLEVHPTILRRALAVPPRRNDGK